MNTFHAENRPQPSAKYPQIPFEIVVPLSEMAPVELPREKIVISSPARQRQPDNYVKVYTDFEQVEDVERVSIIDVLLSGVVIVVNGAIWIMSNTVILVFDIVKGIVTLVVAGCRVCLDNLTKPATTYDKSFQPSRQRADNLTKPVTRQKGRSGGSINVGGNMTVNGDIYLNNN